MGQLRHCVEAEPELVAQDEWHVTGMHVEPEIVLGEGQGPQLFMPW